MTLSQAGMPRMSDHLAEKMQLFTLPCDASLGNNMDNFQPYLQKL